MLIENFRSIWLFLFILTHSFLLPATAHAVFFATGAKPPEGYQLKLFPLYCDADTRTNKDGNAVVTDLGMKKYGVSIGNFYQLGDLQVNAIIPVGNLELGKYHSDDAGIGDVQLRAGWYLPVKWASILPIVMVKVPTGDFNKNSKANFGDGQTDLVTELYFFKLVQPFSFDAVVRYNVRFRNPDSDITPGNEFSAEGLATYRLAEKIRVGPAVNFLIGEDSKKTGKFQPDSGVMRLAVGGEIWYGRFEHVKISLAAYKDLLTRNTYEGVLVTGRIVFEF